MEELEVKVEIQREASPASSPPLVRKSESWALLSGPVPLAGSLSPSPLLPESAGHALHAKAKTLYQRPGRREREKERETETEGPDLQAHWTPIFSQALSRQKGRGKGRLSPPVSPWHPERDGSHSSEEEEDKEVEVETTLQLNAYQPEPPGDLGARGSMGRGPERSAPVQPRGLGEGSSVENLQSDSTSTTTDDPPPPKPSSSSSSSSTPSSSTSTTRHWAPPKGFWRVVRPETLLLNGVRPLCADSSLPVKDYTLTSSLPAKDYTLNSSLPVKEYHSTSSLKDHTALSSEQAEPQRRSRLAEVGSGGTARGKGSSHTPWELQRTDSLEGFRGRRERREAGPAEPAEELWSADSWESVCSQDGSVSADETAETNQKARCKRGRANREEGLCVDNPYRYGDETNWRDDRGMPGGQDSDSDLSNLPESYHRSRLACEDLPLSPRHEQAKLLLERARLKARSNHGEGDERPTRHSQPDQRYNNFRGQQQQQQQPETSSSTPPQKPAKPKTAEEVPVPPQPGPLLVPQDRDLSPGESRLRRYGNSPTRVRFEDESEKEAESRYLDRMRERGRGHKPKGSGKEKKAEPRQEEAGAPKQEATVRKCEACGSILRDPPSTTPEPQTAAEPPPPCNADDQREKTAPRWVPPPNQSESSSQSVKVKVPTVTFAGAFVLGEDNGPKGFPGWGKNSGFPKLRRRSRQGPYGPSWAQRRNSNPRIRGQPVTFAPGGPIVLERPLVDSRRGDSPTPAMPIKSALKSSCKSRAALPPPSVQFQLTEPDQELEEAVSMCPGSPEQRGESEGAAPPSTSLVPCIRPSSLRYSPARLTPDLPPAELWTDGAGVVLPGDMSPPMPEGRQRCLGVSQAEDLRAELLRAEHLKAEAQWEDGPDGARADRDGRPKLSLRRFFSSIGLNSVGRLVKGARSSSMEQLSVPSPRTSSSSSSPTLRPRDPARLQRTPSLQALNTVSPLAQLRKVSSVQSLERRTERSTILGELQMPYGLAPRVLQRTVSVEDVLSPRGVRPVGRVSQALPDGTLLLELTRPPNEPFGFLISRGKGRACTGVYIAQVGNGSGEGLYVGLLEVGDEILEVNEEPVAGLSLDQVTRLMTRDSTASLRILPYRRSQHRR